MRVLKERVREEERNIEKKLCIFRRAFGVPEALPGSGKQPSRGVKPPEAQGLSRRVMDDFSGELYISKSLQKS